MKRREFINTIGLASAAIAAGPSIAKANTRLAAGLDSSPVHCRVLNHQGKPIPVNELQRFHICDIVRCIPFTINPQYTEGEISFIPANEPFRISIPLTVPGFGTVFVYADNRGKGYTPKTLFSSKPLFLNYEFAADRLTTTGRLIDECKKEGISISSAALLRVNEAEKLLKRSEENKNDEQTLLKWSMESLRESLWAGEMIVLQRAQQRISRQEKRKGFLFGCNTFKYPRKSGNVFTDQYEKVFNLATLPFYLGQTEKIKGQINYSSAEKQLEWLRNKNIICKGHPLIFLNPEIMPDWFRNLPYNELKQYCLEYIKETILRFRGQIHVWDVINEAHVQPEAGTGVKGYTKEENVDLTCEALKAARKADPSCFRIVNSTGTWSDYYMTINPLTGQQSVYDYIKMLQSAGADFEAIGLQFYYSGRDFVETEREIEKYREFGKSIHITESGIPTSSEGSSYWGGGEGGASYVWHGEKFTEDMQADWLEYLYTIVYSKPYIDAITWWDYADPSFMYLGGLLRADLSPRPSYERLIQLQNKWS
jgi:endo-1,4-beta-xylanase